MAQERTNKDAAVNGTSEEALDTKVTDSDDQAVAAPLDQEIPDAMVSADKESPASPPPSPESVVEEDEKEDDADEDFEPKDEDAPEDEEEGGPTYVKENIKDLQLEPSTKNDSTVESDPMEEMEDEDDDESPNPYLTLTNPAVMEWLGRKTAKLLTVSDIQSVFHVLLLREQMATANKQKKKGRVAVGDIGESAASLLSSTDELIWSQILSSNLSGGNILGPSSRIVLKLAEPHEDDDVVKWETQYFGKTNFVVGLANDDELYASQAETLNVAARDAEQRFKVQKAHDTWRFKGIHAGYTVWPSWSDAVKALIQQRRGSAADDSHQQNGDTESAAVADSTDSDLQLARALAEQAAAQDAASGRRTRRGGESGVFYGSQSNMTPKQLMDMLLRLTSQADFKTALLLLGAVPDESTDPLRRIRTALGRLVWKRNQLARLTIDNDASDKELLSSVVDQPLLRVNDVGSERGDLLCRYLQQLHETELRLRRLVLDNMSRVPVTIVATAADERPGSMECMDAADYEDQSTIEWHATGHELIGQLLFRPSQVLNTDDASPCRWFRVKDFAPTVALLEEIVESSEPSAIGNAKEPTSVERRMRFRVMPVNSPDDDLPFEQEESAELLLLTEGQTRAGMLAAEMFRQESDSSRQQVAHPFASGLFTKICLVSSDNGSAPRSFTVVGHDSVEIADRSISHRVLVMPDDVVSNTEAVWATLQQNSTSCLLDNDPVLYSIQFFDYDSSSPAYQECQKIVKFLQRQDKAGLFLSPVDPIALNIPTYRSIIKHPMDVSTVERKLFDGDYANVLPGQTPHRTAIGRMLNGPFRKDVELIFDNAMLFNPTGDWVHTSAAQLKSAVLKKIEQATGAAEGVSSGRTRYSNSLYVDDDSVVDMYVYESDQDEEYGSSRRSKKRKQPTDSIPKEDNSARAMERSYKLQKILGDVLGGPLANLPVKTDPSTFSLPAGWSCRRSSAEQLVSTVQTVDQDDEIDNLIALQQQVDEQESSGLRRSTRAHIGDERSPAMERTMMYTYFNVDHLLEASDPLPCSRSEVEMAVEKLHESFYAEAYREHSNKLASDTDIGRFADESFPPFLGRVVPLGGNGEATWEIRSALMLPALRWVIRGLIKSGHIGEIEPLSIDSLLSGSIIANHAYYIDDRQPYDVIDVRELQRRKRAGQEAEEQAEEEVELSEYEKLRAERVARNAERLRALGLA